MVKIAIAGLLAAMLLCSCNDKKTKQSMEKAEEIPPIQISEKCIALLAYGLLSDDENDVPFGGACKDVASDSLVIFLQSQKLLVKSSGQNEKMKECKLCHISDCITLLAYELLSDYEIDVPVGVCKNIVSDSLAKYLQLQKRIFKRWQKDRIVDAKEIMFNMGIDTDIRLLGYLIDIRVKIGPTSVINDKTGTCDDDCDECGGYICSFEWDIDADNVLDIFGADYSFIWKLHTLGYTGHGLSLNLDTLNSIASFDDFAAYLDLSFTNGAGYMRTMSNWCEELKIPAQELKKFLNRDSSSKDFLLKYYDLRCKED
ncbi:MAG: hypothetical protein LBH25_14280 [Fibromonadaceae bacterium]|jgi:hypothetical protein|nr:hypothetical protein [Fibromonadaceae bacterium]